MNACNLGDKFCVLVGNVNKVTPLIYKLGKMAPTVISKLDSGTQLNTVEWAPQGGWLAVYGAGSSSGQVLFIDASGSEPTRYKSIEHPSLSTVCYHKTLSD